MRLIRKNVEREAEGSAAEKLISDGFTPMKEATSDTIPEEKIGKDIEDMSFWMKLKLSYCPTPIAHS